MKIIKKIILLILLLSINLFSNDIATISAIKGSATIEREAKTIEVLLGTKLMQKDIIKTKDNSKLQIIFKDETIISIGKNSRFSIEEYLFEEDKTPIAKFNILQGVMKTITGKIGKIAPHKFTVKAKTSTIGIRGTNFVVTVKDNGSYQAYCTYGAISVTLNGEVHIVKKGFVINISVDGKVELKKFSPKDLQKMEKDAFQIKGKNKSEEILDVELNDDGDLDMSFGDSNEIVIQDISDTISDMDRIVEDKPVEKKHTEHDSHFDYPTTGY